MWSNNLLIFVFYFFQHANEDVERMLLGNKCDMDDKRVVPKAKGEQVRWCGPVPLWRDIRQWGPARLQQRLVDSLLQPCTLSLQPLIKSSVVNCGSFVSVWHFHEVTFCWSKWELNALLEQVIVALFVYLQLKRSTKISTSVQSCYLSFCTNWACFHCLAFLVIITNSGEMN